MVNSVKKALGVLDILVFEDYNKKGLGLFELSSKTGIKPNTLHSILKTMIDCGYVSQNENSKYMYGPKCDNICFINKISPNSELFNKIMVELTQLSERIKEPSVFAILIDGSRHPIMRVEYDNHIKVDHSRIDNDNIYSKDTGSVLVAHASERDLKKIVDIWGYPDNIKTIEELKKNFENVRKTGVSTSVGGDGDVLNQAVVVFDKSGKLFGSIGSYAPAFRCDSTKQKYIIEELKKSAEVIKNFT